MTERCECIFQDYCENIKSRTRAEKEDLILLFYNRGSLGADALRAAGITLPPNRRPALSLLGGDEHSKLYSHWLSELTVHQWGVRRSTQALLYLVEMKDAELDKISAVAAAAQASCSGPVQAEMLFPICTSPLLEVKNYQVSRRLSRDDPAT